MLGCRPRFSFVFGVSVCQRSIDFQIGLSGPDLKPHTQVFDINKILPDQPAKDFFPKGGRQTSHTINVNDNRVVFFELRQQNIL